MLEKINDCLLYIVDTLSEDNLKDLIKFEYLSLESRQSDLSLSNDSYMFQQDEQHDFFELCFVIEGKSIIQLHNYYYILEQNQLCFIDRKTPHGIGWSKIASKNSFLLWVAALDNMLRIHISDYGPDEIVQPFGLDILDTNNFLLKEISREITENKQACSKAIIAYFKAFLFLLYRKIESNYVTKNTKWRNKIISEAEEYISSNYDSKLTLKEISDAVAVSPNYLSALFRQVTGLNLNEYIRNIKVEKIKELLSGSDLGLSEIALQLGFYDQFHLSKNFKQATGMSPTAYKKSNHR
jgi:AraC-type DNA-binding domain-containing proteins